MHDLTDRELVDRILAGDRKAADVFLCRYQGLMRSVANRVIGKRQCTAAAIPQEVCIRLLEDDGRVLREWRGEGSIRPYLTKVTLGVAVDYSRWKLRPWSVQFPEWGLDASDREPWDPVWIGDSPYQEVVEGELREAVLRAIDALPPGQGEILVLTEIKEMEIPAAAAALGIKVNAAYRRRYLAFRSLERILLERNPHLFRPRLGEPGFRRKNRGPQSDFLLEGPSRAPWRPDRREETDADPRENPDPNRPRRPSDPPQSHDGPSPGPAPGAP